MGAAPDGLTCRSCGHANRAGRKFCAECGVPLAVACATCGAANEPGERFCGECGSPLAVGASPERAGVERRFVSVLFADLVGFTSLAEDRDAEDVRELLTRYFDLAKTLIERHGGTVEKFIGDAVMAVWGTPTAREDDAERAVRTGLELVSGVAALGEEVGLSGLGARAGVLTGEAAVTLGAVGQGMVAGDLVNAASRVQALAEPGTVLVGEATRRATEASIAYEEAGVHELKGREEPVQLWQALRITAGRGGTLRADVAEPPFVGRDRELRLLKELFHASAEEQKAHLVSIVGIAGIGKSRVAWELQKYLDGVEQTVRWHSGRCLAYGDGVAFWALAEMVRMRAGIAEGEEPGSARAKVRATLEQYVDDEEERDWIEPRLAQLLALDEQEAGERQDLFAAWRLFFERIAERDPVVLVLEDVQWADAALLEFVEYLLEWSRNHAIFVVLLARPELGTRHSQWGPGRNSTTLALEPLSQEAMQQLLDGFAPGLPDALRGQVLDRAEGVPLYAVETVRMLLDRGLLESHEGGYRPTKPIDALEVPETLQALVAARLDGLGPDERRLVQDASVIGKTFTRAALATVAGSPEEELEQPLAELVRKEILSLKADPRSPERGQYAFLQDLVRQIAYDTLSRRERKLRHLAAAAHLEQGWSEAEHELAEILASHYLAALQLDPEADDASRIREQAGTTLVKAGERAASLAASESAQRYFEQALELAGSPLDRAELHERAGRMAMLADRPAASREHFEAAIATLEEIGLEHPAARVTAQLGILTWQQEHDLDRAIALLERSFVLLAEDERDADLATLTVQLGRMRYFHGDLDEALAKTELALELGEALRLPDVLSHGFNTKALILHTRGRHEEAELLMRHSLDVAVAHGTTAAIRGFMNLTYLLATRDAFREALALALEGIEYSRRIGDRDGGRGLQSWTFALEFALGRWDEALAGGAERPDQERGWLLPLLLFRGDRAGAAERLASLEAIVDPSEVQQRTMLGEMRALMLVNEGKPREALAAAEWGLESRLEIGMQAVQSVVDLALEAAFALRDDAKVDELLGLVEALPPGELTPSYRALGARYGARRAALRGDAGTASAGFTAAADLNREIERPFELAVVLLEHAEWLAGEGRVEEAQPLLDEAREIFQRLRAAPWLERADRLSSARAESSVIPA